MRCFEGPLYTSLAFRTCISEHKCPQFAFLTKTGASTYLVVLITKGTRRRKSQNDFSNAFPVIFGAVRVVSEPITFKFVHYHEGCEEGWQAHLFARWERREWLLERSLSHAERSLLRAHAYVVVKKVERLQC